MEQAVERVVRVRRRGKEIIKEPYIANSNTHNELGRVQVERHTPFRGPTSDVSQCAVRSNFDFQFMPRAPVLNLDTTLGDAEHSAGKPKENHREEQPSSSSGEKPGDVRQVAKPGNKKTLTYDRAEAFYGIRLQLPHDHAMRAAAHSMLAMWQAAHNTDYYITKYGTKALEQLQNLIGQFALGLRRLEVEEQQERDAGDAAVLAQQQDYKRRARRITLRLAMAANRATWASCCEMALFIRTKAHVRKTYFPRDIYLSRLAYLSQTCLRLLNSGNSFLLEASDLMHHGTTGLSTLSFSAAAAQTEPSPLSNVAKLAEGTNLKDDQIPLSNVAKLANATALEDNGIHEDLQDPSEIRARDDDADENDSNNDQEDTEQESE